MNLDIMKERYESLPVVELRAVAKARGMKGISAEGRESESAGKNGDCCFT